jgi:hypothetical protein
MGAIGDGTRAHYPHGPGHLGYRLVSSRGL